jgi:hypothetical protein
MALQEASHAARSPYVFCSDDQNARCSDEGLWPHNFVDNRKGCCRDQASKQSIGTANTLVLARILAGDGSARRRAVAAVHAKAGGATASTTTN